MNNSEIKKLKVLMKQKDSEINALQMKNTEQSDKIQSLERQIVQILSGGNIDVAQRIEHLTKDILTFDPNYFEHCAYSDGFDEAIKNT